MSVHIRFYLVPATHSQFAFHLCASVNLWASDTVRASFLVTFPHSFASTCLLACGWPAGHCVRSINQMVGQLAKMPRQMSDVWPL